MSTAQAACSSSSDRREDSVRQRGDCVRGSYGCGGESRNRPDRCDVGRAREGSRGLRRQGDGSIRICQEGLRRCCRGGRCDCSSGSPVQGRDWPRRTLRATQRRPSEKAYCGGNCRFERRADDCWHGQDRRRNGYRCRGRVQHVETVGEGNDAQTTRTGLIEGMNAHGHG